MEIQTNQILTEILHWIRASSHSTVGGALKQALPSDNMRRAYQALDGTRTVKDVKKECGIGSNTINELIGRCCAMGLMERQDGLPTKRLFDLRDFDLLPVTRGAEEDE